MEEINDMKIFYHKLHKYRKLGEKLLAISIKRSDRYTFGLENKISKLYKFILDNLEKINYTEEILSYFSVLLSSGWVDFKYVSEKPEYKVFYEIRNLSKLVNKISDHVKYTEGTREYRILMESDRFSERFEYLIKMADNIKEIVYNPRIDKDKENSVHSGFLKLRNQYVKSIRSTKALPVIIGNVLRGKPGRVEVKFNCGIVKPRLNGIYFLPYDYLKKRYSNEFISINYEQDLDILPNRKKIECRGEMVELDKICILKVTGDVGEILMTYKLRYDRGRGHCLYPFSEGSFYAKFSTFMLESLLK